MVSVVLPTGLDRREINQLKATDVIRSSIGRIFFLLVGCFLALVANREYKVQKV